MELGYLKRPPLPKQKAKLQENYDQNRQCEPEVSRQNNLFPRLGRQVFRLQMHSLQKGRQTPSSQQLIKKDIVKRRNSAARDDQLSVKSQQRSQFSQDETDGQYRSGPQITAKSWMVYEAKRAKYIHGKRIFKKREIASLTKIMNLIVVIDTLKRCQVDSRKIFVRVSKDAAQMTGTTALLTEGMEISIYDLMFGMMLPSGNNAAYALAQAIGSILFMETAPGKIQLDIVYDVDRFTQYCEQRRNCVQAFLNQMNRKAKSLTMFNSFFANPHGLSQTNNLSSAQDMAKLCAHCMDNDLFRRIVATKNYKAQYSICQLIVEQKQQNLLQGQDGCWMDPVVRYVRKTGILEWENTNKLLWQGWNGIKTGITPNAGPCLAACITRYIAGMEYTFIVILINSITMEARWKEAKQLVNWVVNEQLY